MPNDNKQRQCIAQTKTGTPCKNYAVEGSDYCYVHQPEVGESPGDNELTQDELRDELIEELDNLVNRVKNATPDYEPPPFSFQALIDFLKRNLEKFPFPLQIGILERLRGAISKDALDRETWEGIWYLVNYSIEYQTDIVRRHLSGDYETDEWGLDWEFIELVRPFFEFLYNKYWRVETSGLEYIPEEGKALLIANHSGQLPWDGAMLATAVYTKHPAQRLIRNLYATWFSTLPFIATVLERGGQVLANVENGTRLLENGELVSVFPEGTKGVGKLFKDRYKLQRFGRGGFVKMALKTQTDIIPVSIVGAEETYISIYKSRTLAKITGFPYFPISLRFPWTGLFGFVPFPTKWYIDIGEPIQITKYSPDDAENLVLVSQLTDQVRNVIQGMIINRLERRQSVFFG